VVAGSAVRRVIVELVGKRLEDSHDRPSWANFFHGVHNTTFLHSFFALYWG
jgi:hypothetical protein